MTWYRVTGLIPKDGELIELDHLRVKITGQVGKAVVVKAPDDLFVRAEDTKRITDSIANRVKEKTGAEDVLVIGESIEFCRLVPEEPEEPNADGGSDSDHQE